VRHRVSSLSFLVAACAAALVAACGGDSPSSPTLAKQESGGQQGTGNTTGGTDSTGHEQTPPATGPVASVRIAPTSISVALGNYVPLTASALNAKGEVLTGKKFTWRSDDPSIVAVSDTGLLRAQALGSTTVHAAVDGKEAAATVTVVRDDPNLPPVIDKFTVHGSVIGVPASGDTTLAQWAATPIAGATVKVYQYATAKGDTLATPVLYATVTSDAEGKFTLPDVPSAYYTVQGTPPAGSPWQNGTTSFGPQRGPSVYISVPLRAKE
jgi:hypothetical protein